MSGRNSMYLGSFGLGIFVPLVGFIWSFDYNNDYDMLSYQERIMIK